MIKLTDREKTVLEFAAAGKSAWATAVIMGISEHTVNYHRKSVFQKLNTASLAQAVGRAVKLNLIEVEI